MPDPHSNDALPPLDKLSKEQIDKVLENQKEEAAQQFQLAKLRENRKLWYMGFGVLGLVLIGIAVYIFQDDDIAELATYALAVALGAIGGYGYAQTKKRQ